MIYEERRLEWSAKYMSRYPRYEHEVHPLSFLKQCYELINKTKRPTTNLKKLLLSPKIAIKKTPQTGGL
jgi:hypothetical protein